MIPKAFDAIEIGDILALIGNSVRESRTLEFKRDLPGNGDEDTREFLADVSSLANASGGDLIFGIEDVDGVATAIAGVDVQSPDQEILRLEGKLQSSLDPRVIGIRSKWIEHANGRGIVIIRAPASLSAPHRLNFKGHGKFFNRNSAGKYSMDTHELRRAFNASEGLPAALTKVHREWAEMARGKDLPFGLPDLPSAFVSVLPLSAVQGEVEIEVDRNNCANPVDHHGISCLPVIEGMISYSKQFEGSVDSIALTRRAGTINFAWTIGHRGENLGNNDKRDLVFMPPFADHLKDAVSGGIDRLKALGLDGPFAVVVSVDRIQGFSFMRESMYIHGPCARASIDFPPLILEEYAFEKVLPIIKAFWLAFNSEMPERGG